MASGDTAASSHRPPVTAQRFRRLNMNGLMGLAAKINFNDPNQTAESEQFVAEIGDHLLDKIDQREQWFCQRKDRAGDCADDSAAECLSFAEWITRFLLNLFSQPPPHHLNPHATVAANSKVWIFDKCSKALTQLLRAVGRNDPVSFRIMQSNLSDLAVDLVRFRLYRIRSQRMGLVGQRLTLQHVSSFAPSRTLRWPLMALTTATTNHELENLICGVVGSLIESLSFNPTPLDDEVQQLFFQMAHVSGVRSVENACLKWFTCISDWRMWAKDKIVSFLNKWFSPLLAIRIEQRDENGIAVIPAELQSGLSTIFHLMYFTRHEDVWRQQILIWLIRIGWDADADVRKKAVGYISALSELFDYKRETEKVFIADAGSLTVALMDLLLKEQTRGLPEDVFHSGITMFGKCFAYAFRYIVVKAVTSSDPAVMALACKIVQKSDSAMKDLILKHFASICGMLLDQLENWKDLEKALDKVAQLADMRLIEIMSKRQRFVATEVMFYYHVRQKNVMTIINSLSRSKSGPAVSCNASLSNFLIQNHTLSDMLTVATCHIKRKGIGRYSGEFRSLIDVIHIAGSEGVRQVQSLIAPLLNFCVRLLNQTNDDYELIAEFYSAYLQNVPFKILGQNLLLICKDLYEQLLPKHKAKAIQLLERVICGQLDLLKAALRQVSFVRKREDADFSRLNKAIDFICAKYPEEAAIDYVKFRTREIAGTRECMLKVLKIGDLRNYISRHYETLIIADSVDPCISPLISVLLNDAKHPDEELTLAIARCLGEIGAIDPARFDTIPASDPCPENEIFSHDIGSKSVLKKLVSKVSRSSVSFSDLNSQWLIMFVLQELMQSIALNDHPAFLRLLDNDVRFDCESVTDSQFTISPECVTREVELIPPASSVFHFRESSSDPLLKYENWLRIWAKRMILKMTKRSAAYKVLMGCAPLFAKDYRLTECLLPCVVFNFLCDEGISANDKTRIFFNEIDAVITSVVPKDYLSSHPNTFENSTCGTSDVVVSAPVLNELQHLSAQQIFVVYEKLQQWNASLKAPLVHELSANLTPQCLAALAYACRSHARSILYLEKHFREMKVKERPSYLMQLLQKNFIALEEPDGVVGVETCCIEPPSLIDRVMANESTCQLRQALTFCDKAARSEPDEIAYPKLVTRCLLSLDLTQQAYYHAIGLVSRSEKWGRAILPLQIQAAWRLSMWPELTQLLEQVTYDEEETGMNVHFGRILSHISQKDTDGLCRTLDAVRCIALNPVAAVVSEKGAYLRCYSSLVKLHMITDMQRAALDLCDMKPEPNTRHEAGVEVLGSIWKFRNKSIMASCQTLEPVLSMQRVLCSIYPQNKQDELAQQLAESWLKSATIARKSANLPKAENCVLELESLMAKDVVTSCTGLLSRVMVEVAKCYWAGQDSSSKERAVKYLSRGIEKYFSTFIVTSGRSAQAADDSRKDYARVRLLHTQFLAESQAADSKILIAGYTDAMMADKQWEKPAFRLARLYDRIAAHTIKHTDKVGLMYNACYYYFVSLQRGCKKIYRSLPRLIDLWCDMGTIDVFFTTALQVSSDRQSGVPAGEGNSRRTALSDRPRRSVKNVVVTDERHEEIRVTQAAVRKEFQKLMSNIFVNIHKVLPSEYLYTAFSQMLSLTTHSNEMLTKCLCDILARVVYEHPQQCVWLILPAVMSDTDSVVAAANRILSTAATTSEEKSFNKLMKEAGKLFWDVAHAGEKISKAVKKIDLSRLGPGDKLKKLLTDSRILLPYRKFMRVEMPPGGLRDDKHKYFASPVTIAGVEDEVDIFHSVARPKKITLIGSDGNRYPLLVKPKDDMRMDSRTMELIEVVNRLLRKDAESRKRQLSIRSFHVVPLGSAGGLVEFIDGVRDIRQILLDEYARSGMIDPKTFLKDVKDKYPEYKETSQSVARTKFQKDVIPMVQPAVFGSWFMRQFTDASGWHVARNEFTRSLAVMSIVGYVVGLGDRHLENILLDTATGQVIHVDFNLLFNNGKSLQVPEVVPFRLTHNLIDVMGVTGYEGHFRKTCEITLQVMRNNREELLSVLKPFVFDPFAGHDAQSNKKSFAEKVSDIVSSRGSATARDIEKIEVQDETAVADLAGIDDRLRGCIENDTVEYALPLSVAGQVNLLIKDATDPDKLCRMYVGWASYL